MKIKMKWREKSSLFAGTDTTAYYYWEYGPASGRGCSAKEKDDITSISFALLLVAKKPHDKS